MSTDPVPSPALPEDRGVNGSELAAVLDRFVATVTGDFTITDVLRQLALGVTRVLWSTDAGVAAPDPEGGGLRVVFTTSAPVHELERVQETVQEGPCQDCYDSGQVINLAEPSTEGAWPDYQRRADEQRSSFEDFT